jgi:hypothetical protein
MHTRVTSTLVLLAADAVQEVCDCDRDAANRAVDEWFG